MRKRAVTRTSKTEALIPCFVISPIGKPRSSARKHADAVFEYIIAPSAADCGFDPKRIDHEDGCVGRALGQEIVKALSTKPLCIADLSTRNPNVFWEVGVRHAWDLPILQLAQKGTRLPFDTFDRHTIFYELDDRKPAIRTLKRALQAIKRTHLRPGDDWPPAFVPQFSHVMQYMARRYAMDDVLNGKKATIALARKQLQKIADELDEDTERGNLGTQALPQHVNTLAREIALLRGSIHAFECIRDGHSDDRCHRHCGDLLSRMRGVIRGMVQVSCVLGKADAAEDDFRQARQRIDTIVAACIKIEASCQRTW